MSAAAELQELFGARISFTRDLGEWLVSASDYLEDHGGLYLLGKELERGKQQAEWNAENGVGIADSLHRQGLAFDFAIWGRQGGNWVLWESVSEDLTPYEKLGERWELASPLNVWGGRFDDAGHISRRFGGRA